MRHRSCIKSLFDTFERWAGPIFAWIAQFGHAKNKTFQIESTDGAAVWPQQQKHS